MKAYIKSIWVSPWENESGAPEKRIIHGKYVNFMCRQDRIRVGIRLGQGYSKCGSENAADWITEFAVYHWKNQDWVKTLHITGIEKPKYVEDIVWFEIQQPSQAYFLEARRSGVDGWWTCYNIVNTGFIVEAYGFSEEVHRPERKLHKIKCELNEPVLSAENISAVRSSTSIRFSTPYYSIGFRLKSAGLDFLAFDGAGTGKIHENMLVLGAMLSVKDDDFYTQGPVINPVSGPSSCGFLSYDIEGETEVCDNLLTYRLTHMATGLITELAFTMKRNAIQLSFRRSAEKTIKLLDSTPFRIAFNTCKAPLTALGSVVKKGETGAVSLPLLLHLPGYAGINLEGGGPIWGRFSSACPKLINIFDFEIGESPCEDGCYLIKKGTYSAEILMTVGFDHHIALADNTPEAVRQVFGRYVYTCLPYRADTATFSNNGNSVWAPICMDLWAELCVRIGKGCYGIDPLEFLKNTIELHLIGAPAYAAGRHFSGEYDYEDEYLMTGTAVLLGIARYLEIAGSKVWFEQFGKYILQKVQLMKARDIDADGLVESVRRKGISGEHQWSTCWYDVISFGYKDAFSNALLYKALRILSLKTKEYGKHSLSHDLEVWADKIKAIYTGTFMTENGWLAGWKCMKGQLHDYGFLPVNGAAVSYGLLEGTQAKTAVGNLWSNLLKSGYDSFDMGLPGNIYNINNADMAVIQHDLPFGGYQNGGITFSQSRHFINALYTVGMREEADYILNEMCKGLLYGGIIGGVGSGCDWKTWDGIASGYEGLLTDQLGIFSLLIEKYGI